MKDLVIIAGPTATGKSAAAVKLAKRIGGSIISADSMQVYRGMDIGTAKITKEEMQGIDHYLIDVFEPQEDFNIVTFQTMAKEAIIKIKEKGKIPIIVGGTGFYIQSVLYDIDFTESVEDEGYRKELAELIEEKGGVYVHGLLEEADPEAAKAIHHNDSKRMIRALEFFKATGMRISSHNSEAAKQKSPYDFAFFVLCGDRQEIYDRIDRRVDDMIESGLEDEVRKLLASGLSLENVSMQGLGYKEMIEYITGNITEEEAIYRIKRDSRHYAKRQITWFKREKDTVMIDMNDPLMTEKMTDIVIS